MSCFWQGLIRKVPEIKSCARSPQEVLALLKKKNQITPNVHWQGQPLSSALLLQNYKDVQSYDAPVTGGHLTSSCDPFLLLVAQIYRCHIRFKFAGSSIAIDYVPSAEEENTQPIPTYTFSSSRTHFS